eukprot:jgi/Picsp_1/5556/NSC_02915-R1_---NA---
MTGFATAVLDSLHRVIESTELQIRFKSVSISFDLDSCSKSHVLQFKLDKLERVEQQSGKRSAPALISFESIAKLFQPLLQCSCLGPEALVEHIGKRKRMKNWDIS